MSRSNKLITASEIAQLVSKMARERRLAMGLKQSTLARKAGISLASLKRFENNHEISFTRLLKIAHTLDCLDGFSQLFPEHQAITLAELEKKEKNKIRKRGHK